MSKVAEFSPEMWIPKSPVTELYAMYHATIAERFRPFGSIGIADFVEIGSPFGRYRTGKALDENTVNAFVNQESRESFQEKFAEFVVATGIDDWLEHRGSVVFGLNHDQFTDVPITAETVARIGLAPREQIVQVISRMVTQLELYGEGVHDEIVRKISASLATIPRLDGSPSHSLAKYRRYWNDTADAYLQNILQAQGAVTIESVIGRHNIVEGDTLYIHEPNIRTFEQLFKSNTDILFIPLYLSCISVQPNGNIEPGTIRFEFFEPIHGQKPEDVKDQTVEHLLNATRTHIGERYAGGVQIKTWLDQKKDSAGQMARDGAAEVAHVTSQVVQKFRDRY